MTLRRSFEITVPGEPRGAGRPRFGRGRDGNPRAYTAKADREYAALIAAAWRDDGCPYIASGAWTCELTAYMERPRDHRKADGSLSARGERSPHPGRKPDADNILKVIDALVAVAAVPDDRLLIEAHVAKRWAEEGEARLVVRVEAA
jgi:Holliday junction resolvase RusA-like endonuclease